MGIGLISVIVPVYNAARYVREAIDSIVAQTYDQVEIIAVNDGSTDQSLHVLSEFAEKITIIDSVNKGIASARNLGIAATKGHYLAFLDADDTWEANKLRLQLDHLNQNPSMDMVFCSFQEFLSPDLQGDILARRVLKAGPMKVAAAGTMLVPRNVFDRVGLFSEELRSGEFIDWFARAKELGLAALFTDDCLYHRRSHDDNHTLKADRLHADYLRVIKAALDRRRQANGQQK